MKEECSAFETALSFHRRLAQARIEILEAERSRRERGESLGDLIEHLPEILADRGRSGPAQARIAEAEMPSVDLEWPDGRGHLVSDTTLASLPDLDDATLDSTIAALSDFERELSDLRHRLHVVLDAVEHEVATRRAAGKTG